MLYVAVARSFSGGVAIRYVLPILWTTPYLLIMGRMKACDIDTVAARDVTVTDIRNIAPHLLRVYFRLRTARCFERR